jgi:uncharacterized protein
MSIFHYAFKVKDIESTVAFYNKVLGCRLGDSTETWIDFDFFGHQLSAHISKDIPALDYCGKVDGVSVPIPHFGCIISEADFVRIQASLQKADIHFVIRPQTRYPGKKGEQLTMFVLDFSGNPIEFKAFKNPEEIFDR